MNENNTIEVPIKAEEIPTIIVDDTETTTINVTDCGNKWNRNCSKKLKYTVFQLAAKMRQLEELEQNLKNRFNNEPCGSNINIVKPTFSTKQLLHPLNFIEDHMIYLDKLPEVQRTIDTVVDCVDGDARNWATIFKPRWNIPDDFIRDFLDQYWGMEDQSLLKKQILNGKWFPKEETMCRHFTNLISQARWLKHKMSDEELVYEMMHHYPNYIQIAWYVSQKKTILEATEFLKKMDEIHVVCQGKKGVKQRQSMQMKYKTPGDQVPPACIPEDQANARNSKRFKRA